MTRYPTRDKTHIDSNQILSTQGKGKEFLPWWDAFKKSHERSNARQIQQLTSHRTDNEFIPWQDVFDDGDLRVTCRILKQRKVDCCIPLRNQLAELHTTANASIYFHETHTPPHTKQPEKNKIHKLNNDTLK